MAPQVRLGTRAFYRRSMTVPSPGRPPLSRRHLLLGTAALGALVGCSSLRNTASASPPSGNFEVTHTDAEWRKQLTSQQYDVLRNAGTETPYSSPLNDEHRTGVFSCAGCALDLFSSTTKFDSGTGWPSFWKPLDNAVTERTDDTLGMSRTEVLCRRCGGHLGHVFDDGPKPTGLRYCMNGVAMNFRAT
jgi:peptide-methionine (R)-S-oxide reductase